MAFNTKYIAKYYSKEGTNGTIYFKKDNYSGSIITLLLAKDGFEFSNRLSDWLSSPIVSQSISIDIVNEKDDYFELDDLLSVGEKEFLVEVIHTDTNNNSTTLFTGWLNSETTQQNYLRKSVIRLTASNYLSKIGDKYPDSINDTKVQSLIDTIQHTLNLTGITKDIYVNNKLYPYNYNADPSTTCFNLAGVHNEFWWENNEERTKGLDIIKKILTPFDSYIYSWNNKWYIERFGDIDPSSGTKTYNKYEEYMEGYFHYGFTDTTDVISIVEPSINFCDLQVVNYSQVMKMEPGLKEFDIKTKPKAFVSLAPIDYYHGSSWIDVSTKSFLRPDVRGFAAHYYTDPSIGDILTYREDWNSKYKDIYQNVHQNAYGTDQQLEISPNTDYVDKNYILKYFGHATEFEVTIPDTGDDAYTLKIQYKWNPVASKSTYHWHWKNQYIEGYKLYWWLMDGTPGIGPLSAYYIKEDASNGVWYKTDYNTSWNEGPNVIEVKPEDVDQNTGTYTVNLEIPLADVSVLSGSPFEGNKKLVFGIGHSSYNYAEPANPYEGWIHNTRIGDLKIELDRKYHENIVVASVNNNFIQKKNIQFDIFDNDDYGSTSSLLTASDWNKLTTKWIEYGEPTESYPITHHFLRERMRTYQKNRRSIEMNFRTTDLLKPFTIMYDDQFPTTIKYLLTNYTYIPTKDEYKATFLEYDNEEEVNIIES